MAGLSEGFEPMLCSYHQDEIVGGVPNSGITVNLNHLLGTGFGCVWRPAYSTGVGHNSIRMPPRVASQSNIPVILHHDYQHRKGSYRKLLKQTCKATSRYMLESSASAEATCNSHANLQATTSESVPLLLHDSM